MSRPRSPTAGWPSAARRLRPLARSTAESSDGDAPKRTMADLSAYPDLVVIFLGMRVEEPRGLETLQTLGP